MILCDFLSRVAADGGDPMDLVPVAFNGMSIMQERNNHSGGVPDHDQKSKSDSWNVSPSSSAWC